MSDIVTLEEPETARERKGFAGLSEVDADRVGLVVLWRFVTIFVGVVIGPASIVLLRGPARIDLDLEAWPIRLLLAASILFALLDLLDDVSVEHERPFSSDVLPGPGESARP
ncbi:MAG: hypothetical protein U1E65_12405 [Myxococcota bacterium]